MFDGCHSLKNIDLSNFDTQNFINMRSLLDGYNSLTNIDLSKFDTRNVFDMSCMFSGCKLLTKIIYLILIPKMLLI